MLGFDDDGEEGVPSLVSPGGCVLDACEFVGSPDEVESDGQSGACSSFRVAAATTSGLVVCLWCVAVSRGP